MNLHVSRRLARGGAATRSSRPARASAAGSAATRSGSRSRWSPRTRPGRSPSRTHATPPTGTRWARLLAFAGHEVEREYYYNDAGRADGALLRLGRGGPARRGAARGRLPRRRTSPSSPRFPAIPCRRCSSGSRRRSSASASTSTRWALQSERRGRDPRGDRAPRHVRGRTGRCGRGRARTATTRTACSCARTARRRYFAADAAYIRRKYARGFDRLIYVLGADHHGYVARLQALAEMLGHPRESLEVLIYQLVHLVEGGEAKKMSKRRGDVVFLDELLDTIGVDAARWYLVSRGHDQTIELDVDLAKQRTQKNPVYYVQYAHARIAGILRNAGGVTLRAAVLAPRPLAAEERELVKRLLEFPTRRRRGRRAAGAARDPDLRDPGRRRLPPLLPRAPRARVRAGGVPARPVRRRPGAWSPAASTCRGRGARTDVGSEDVERGHSGPEPRARARPRHRVGRDVRVALDRARGQDRGRPGRRRRDAAHARHRLDARRRRDRRGREGRGADALQRRGGRRRRRARGRRRRRPARGHAAHRARHAERDLGDRRRRARDDVLPRRGAVHGQDRRRAGGGGRDRHRRVADREPRARRRGEARRR